MSTLLLTSAIWAVVVVSAHAQFNMWPAVNPTQLASAMGFSVDCLDAMNGTVTCDPDLFRMTGQVDLYYWTQDNLTDLCTTSCIQSASDWLVGVYNACGGQTMVIDSKMVPTESVAVRYSDGIGLACLTDTQLPIMGSFEPTPDVDPITSGIVISSPAPTAGPLTSPSNASSSPGNGTTIEVNNSTAKYCFLEAQNWIGVDLGAPDCSSDPTNLLCTDSDAASRIANLYEDAILCSNCFLGVLWWRINSPFLPDADESDDLIKQYQDITDVCNVTMPPSLIRALPSYPAAPSPTYLPPSTDPNANLTISQNITCGGQTIAASTAGTFGFATASDGSNMVTATLSGAASIARAVAATVTTGVNISNVTTSVSCSADSCKRDRMEVAERNLEFTEFREDYSGYARVKRASAGYCNSLSQTYSVTTGDLQTISGNDDCSFNTTICVPLGCELAQVGKNQSCASFASSLSTGSLTVTVALFLQWNPNIVGLCSSLTTGQYICTGPPGGGYTLPRPISGNNTNAGGQQRGGQGSGTNPNGPNGFENSTMSTTSSTTAGEPIPAFSTTISATVPTQSGLASECNKIVAAQKGNMCYSFAQSNGITAAQLYKWNPVLGTNGANCSLEFQAGEGYCVGVES